MDGRQLIMRLFRDGPAPAVLRMETALPTYTATLADDGCVACEGLVVPRLAEIGRLCREMLDAGLSDGAMQVRTQRGEPVCFCGSIAAIADPLFVPPPPARQLALALGAP